MRWGYVFRSVASDPFQQRLTHVGFLKRSFYRMLPAYPKQSQLTGVQRFDFFFDICDAADDVP